MKGGAPEPGLTIFTGRFGSGKTETALNYALALVQGQGGGLGQPPSEVILIDLDIVTPYFRSREMADRMKREGVQVLSPSVIGQLLDTPAITPQILGAIEQAERPVVLDVGGDRQGARALGQFSLAIRQREYTMHFVVNPYRPFTDTLQGVADSIAEIEASARLQVSSLVSNPNLIGETSLKDIVEGHAKIEGFAQELGLPVAFVCIERRWLDGSKAMAEPGVSFIPPTLVLDRHFVMSWE